VKVEFVYGFLDRMAFISVPHPFWSRSSASNNGLVLDLFPPIARMKHANRFADFLPITWKDQFKILRSFSQLCEF
jgi:hypothetical protein